MPNNCESCQSKVSGRLEKVLFIDHCHVTGIVRGHLCMACNKTLGMFKDSLCKLRKAFMYLNGYPVRNVCVDLEIVWPVTKVDNADELKILRSRKKAELTPKEVKEIRALFAGGMNKNRISKKVRCDPGTVHQIVNRITWKHLD